MEYYNIEVLPVAKLTKEEINSISAEQVMYWNIGNETWLAEKPLIFNEYGSVMDRLFYVFNDLTEAEKIKYRDRRIILHLTREKVTKVYKTKKKVKK